MKRIEISIVMATYNRADLLANQLEAFQGQTISDDRFEIVIVNDGSSDLTQQILAVWQTIMPNLIVINQANAGPAAARNNGVQNASGTYIAFTDDDCVVNKDWLETILNEFETNEQAKVLEGYTFTDKKAKTPLTHQIENNKWNPVIPTCNAAYEKSFFLRLGGFDTEFPFPHNEDTDLAWRVLEQVDVVYVREMKVYHPPIKVPFHKQVKRMNMLKSEFLLYTKNKTSYKKWRATNPWITILWLVFIKHQLLNLKFHLGFYRKPKLLLQGVGLTMGWWLYLLFLLPDFYKESIKYKA